MKTAVSVPDEVFARAERLAKSLKVSRSELYSRALREYIARRSADRVTDALNNVLDDQADQARFAVEASRHVLSRSEW